MLKEVQLTFLCQSPVVVVNSQFFSFFPNQSKSSLNQKQYGNLALRKTANNMNK